MSLGLSAGIVELGLGVPALSHRAALPPPARGAHTHSCQTNPSLRRPQWRQAGEAGGKSTHRRGGRAWARSGLQSPGSSGSRSSRQVNGCGS